ncbi:hypothetical protein [Mycobacterium colombiense]|nr:hypothetical protein [Mycobacterium colombiense]
MSKFSRVAVGAPLTLVLAGAAVVGCGNGSKTSSATTSSAAMSNRV